METIEITNFGGRLTRILNGDLNSGFAKFTPSWGYDPFSKPMNLTWLETPVDITGSISGTVLAGKQRFESNAQFVYVVDSNGKLYKMTPNAIGAPNTDTASLIGTVTNGSATYLFGASIELFGSPEKLFVSHDRGVNSINPDGSVDSVLGAQAYFVQNRFHPLRDFLSDLLIGNGPTIAAIDTTGTVISPIVNLNVQSTTQSVYSQISPPFGPEATVQDMDVSPNRDYIYITASDVPSEEIMTVAKDRQAASATDGSVYKWNGIDDGITAGTTIPSYAVTALQTYLQNNLFFANDPFGTSINDGVNKILTLNNNKSPLPNATGVNGSFLFWVAPEINAASTTTMASMYYFGSLDREMPPGLFRLMRYSTSLSNGFVYQTPFNMLVNNRFSTVNNAVTSIVSLGYGKHYFSTYEVNSGTTGTDVKKLLRFLVTSTGTGTPQSGVYETQTQLFGKKISVKQIRVYTEPTASGNGFQLDCIGSDGAVITNSATNTYSYAAGTDITLLQGSLDRVNFNPVMNDTYNLGIRITNTGTVNMTIKKIEVDWELSGK